MSIRKQGDIYSGPGDQDEPLITENEGQPLDQWRREYLKSKFWSFFLGIIVFIFASGVVWLLIQEYLSLQPDRASNKSDEIRRRSSVLSSHQLSILTDWVIDFREPLDTKIEDVEFNSYWIKRAAYHVINGEQAYRNQDPTAAREQFNKALEIFPDMEGIYYPLGNLALTEEKFEEAIELFEKAAEEQEEMTYNLASNLGAACIGAEKYDKAKDYLSEAIDLQADAAEAYKNMAVLYRKTGEVDAAADYFQKYLDLVPTDMDVIQSYAMYMTAHGRWDKAGELLRKLNTEFPDVAPLFFMRAQVEIQLGNKTDAIKALKRGIKLVDSNYALAWLSKDDFDILRTSQEFKNLSTKVEIDAEEE